MPVLNQTSRTFRPWLRDFGMAAGAAVIAGCALAAMRFIHLIGTARLVAAGLTGIGALSTLALINRAFARLHGQRVEYRAARNIKHLLPLAHVRQGVRLRRGGDADIVLNTNARRWVIEVKSHRSVQIQRRLLSSPRLSRGDGHCWWGLRRR